MIGHPPRSTLFPYPPLFRSAFPQPLEDLDGLVHRGRIDDHSLEPPLERPVLLDILAVLVERGGADALQLTPDRKSTRLNSSHGYISYAVFCLKKKQYTMVSS